MVTRWGMSDRLGMVQLAPKSNPYLNNQNEAPLGSKPFSEYTAQAIDEEVLPIIGECHEEARRLLRQHRPALDALAQALLASETLNEQEIRQVTGLTASRLLEQ
jgi:cell division protease FtsH